MKSISFNKSAVTSFFHRFHLVIFIAILALGLMVVVILLTRVVSKADKPASNISTETTSNFDQDTIDRINKLKTSADPVEPLDFSNGRVDPFNE